MAFSMQMVVNNSGLSVRSAIILNYWADSNEIWCVALLWSEDLNPFEKFLISPIVDFFKKKIK